MSNNQTNSFSKKLLSASRNVLRAGLYLPSLGFILLYPLRWLSGDSLKTVRMVSYVLPWLLAFFLPMLIIAMLTRRKLLSFALAIPCLIIGFTYAPLFFPNPPTAPPPDSFPLKVMSYNQHGIQEIENITEIIRQEKPDILLIQEYSAAFVSPSFHGLDDLYPELYVEVASKDFGQAIFSRYPIKKISAEYDKGRTQKIQIKTPAGSIEVWNVHPIPPYLIPPEQFDAQVSALVTDISKIDGPLIVAGDLNATDQSEAYRAINRYLQDTHWEAGWGFGFGYPAPPYTFMDIPLQTGPLWRIDHVFHSHHFIAVSTYIPTTSGGSDHFPIVAELSMMK